MRLKCHKDNKRLNGSPQAGSRLHKKPQEVTVHHKRKGIFENFKIKEKRDIRNTGIKMWEEKKGYEEKVYLPI